MDTKHNTADSFPAPMYPFYIPLLLLLAATSLFVVGTPAQAGTIVSNAASKYTIVRAATAAAPEKFAAEELQKYLKQISGVTVPIAESKGKGPSILVGSAAGSAQPVNGGGDDGYIVRAAGEDLHLAGNSPRATLFSIYHFLEKQLGCSWIAPGDEVVPHRSEISFAATLNESESPAFSYRSLVLFPYAPDQFGDRLRALALWPYADMQITKYRIDWAAKNRFSYVHPCVNERGPELWEKVHSREEIVPEISKRGLGIHYGGHSYFAWVPPQKYFKDHPEYFAGVKDGKPEVLNIANPEVAKVMAENIIAFLQKNPEVSIITVWMNDAPTPCVTPECFAMNGDLRLSMTYQEGSAPPVITYTNAAVKFANAVAAIVAKSYPKVLINHLAYMELLDAPTNVKPADNVLVSFAPIQRAPFRIGGDVAGYFRPLKDSGNKDNEVHLREMRKWLALSDKFFVWDYYSLWWLMGHDRPRWPFPVVEVMANDLKFYRDELKLTRVSSEIADWHELNMYAYSRLSWNPDLPWRDVIKDFSERAYGAASKPMLEHWELLESSKENWFRQREKCVSLLHEALKLAETPEVRMRINRITTLWQESECQKEGDAVGACKK